MAQGAKGRSRQADPSGQSTNQTRPERVKGTGGEPQRRAKASPWAAVGRGEASVGHSLALVRERMAPGAPARRAAVERAAASL